MTEMSSISISIIIPLYNKVSFVRATVEALLSQLQHNDEIIVVDDVSTDGGFESIQDLKSNCLQLVKLNANSGPATARNRGAEIARGDYLLFFDADDYPHGQLVAILKCAIERYPSEVIFSYDIVIEARGECIENKKFIDNTNFLGVVKERHAYAKSCLAGRHLCTASSTCVEAKIFRDFGGFKSGLRACEDPELWARLSAYHNIVHLPVPLALYRDVRTSLSYSMRGQPGAVHTYVETLLTLSQSHCDTYHLLARSVITKNTVFSLVSKGRRSELRAYLNSMRVALGPFYFISLLLLTYVPISLPRAAFAFRAWRTRARTQQQRTSSHTVV